MTDKKAGDRMYCEKCGSKISAGDRFCEKCGSPVTQIVQDGQEKNIRKSYKGWIIGGVTGCIGMAAIIILFGMGVFGGRDGKKKPDDIAASQPEITAVVTEPPSASSEPEETDAPSVSPESEATPYPEKEDGKRKRSEQEEISEEEEQEDEYMVFNTPEEAYTDYLQLFIDAVNTGKTTDLAVVMDGKCHEQQCTVAENYYSRGIREELQSYSILSVKEVNKECVKITAKEKIKVFYNDGTAKTVKQKYRYTLKLLSHKWYITNMKSAS